MSRISKRIKLKVLLLLVSVLVVAGVSFLYPEQAETVARALMIVVGAV